MAAKSKIPDEALEFFRAQGARGGKKGAAARMAKTTPEQRSDAARKAAAASAKVRTAKAAKKKARERVKEEGRPRNPSAPRPGHEENTK